MNCYTCRYYGLCKYEDEARKFENYLRTMDVWSQMHLYLNTYYPLDKEFLQ